MNLWLKRNRWYLAAIVVIAPLTMLAAMSTDWFAYEERVNGRPILVEQGDPVDYAGASWTLEESLVVPGDSQAGRSADLLEGTDLVVASVRVRPSGVGDSPMCTVNLSDKDGRVTWDQASSSDTSVSVDADAETYCDSEAVEPYLLQVMFVVPSGMATDARLLIKSADELPKLLSFRL